jgi:hypothetical protein
LAVNARTSWRDVGVYDKPLAAEYSGKFHGKHDFHHLGSNGRTLGEIYNQEDGVNGDGAAITSFIQSGYFDIGDGDSMVFMKRFVPDFTSQQGNLEVQLLLRALSSGDRKPELLGPLSSDPDHTKGGHSCPWAPDFVED